MSHSLYIKKEEMKILKEIFKNLDKIYVFGSRAHGAYTLYSDLDLCIYKDAPIFKEQSVEELRENFQKSNLPYKVDICIFENLSDDFKSLVLKIILSIKK